MKKYICFYTYPLKKYLLKKSIKNSSTLRELTNFACIIDLRVVFHFRGVAQLCQIRKILPKITFLKIVKLTDHTYCLQQFDKFWIWISFIYYKQKSWKFLCICEITMKSNGIKFIFGEFLSFESTVCCRNIIGYP